MSRNCCNCSHAEKYIYPFLSDVFINFYECHNAVSPNNKLVMFEYDSCRFFKEIEQQEEEEEEEEEYEDS